MRSVVARASMGMLAGMLSIAACEGGTLPRPDRDDLRQPTGMAMTPDGRWLLIANGNFDFEQERGALMLLDLAALHAALADEEAGQGSEACRTDDGVVVCRTARFVDARSTVLFGSALGNVVLDRPSGDTENLRVLLTQRRPSAVAWADLTLGGARVVPDCGQGEDGVCDADHQLQFAQENSDLRIPRDPSRIVLDDQGARFAYVPHLIDGALSLIDLDSPMGPDVSAVVGEFYQPDPFDDLDVRGGFSAAVRPCDPQHPPEITEDCTRPLVYSTHRWWPGVRQFTVQPGRELVAGSVSDVQLTPIGIENVVSRPFMGDLAFEDPQLGESLLLVQTTPPALARVDTSLDEDDQPRNELIDTVSLCDNPNLLAIDRVADGEDLALVTCYGDGQVAAVGLETFGVVAIVDVGRGANEMVLDDARRVLYVSNTIDSTISLVSLDRRDPRFLTEIARIGSGR